MPIIISKAVRDKLEKNHKVSEREIDQCFQNMERAALLDVREKHKTAPPTQWFISMTNQNRVLKVVFMQQGDDVIIKTGYDPNLDELRIFAKHAAIL